MKARPSQDNIDFLESIKKQIETNLSSHPTRDAPTMTKREMFELSQFTQERLFEESMHQLGLRVKEVYHNAAPGALYEQACKHEPGSYISNTGALLVSSGAKTGRCPQDKRIVAEPSSVDDVWWGKVNIKLEEEAFMINRERAIDFLNTQSRLYVVDGFAGWDVSCRLKIRVITSRAYHALFMQNMLVMPTREEMEDFTPDFVIYNAGCFPANRYVNGITSQTGVLLNFGRKELVILGTQYAGEMKKGIFTLMMHAMPSIGHLPLHSSCNVGPSGDVSLFFGLSGTGKTTLSADPARRLIGDDEHVWTDKGVFNIEGGCYAKCINLSREKEPEIFDSIRFGSVLENVVFDSISRVPNYDDVSVTENTRAAYPLNYIPNAIIPATIDTHPSNIILLTCDAFGVLPPVSKLTPEQVMYHFVSGYTAKVAGTEVGVTEPQATFSACFGAPFLVRHPMVYAEMLAKKLKENKADAWLVNTGWVGGAYGKTGKRCPLKYTRLIIDAIHNGTAKKAEFEAQPTFGLMVPKSLEGVPENLLMPHRSWPDRVEYDQAVSRLADLFTNNFEQFSDRCTAEVKAAGPTCDRK